MVLAYVYVKIQMVFTQVHGYSCILKTNFSVMDQSVLLILLNCCWVVGFQKKLIFWSETPCSAAGVQMGLNFW